MFRICSSAQDAGNMGVGVGSQCGRKLGPLRGVQLSNSDQAPWPLLEHPGNVHVRLQMSPAAAGEIHHSLAEGHGNDEKT
jgi:hypothetical protein